MFARIFKILYIGAFIAFGYLIFIAKMLFDKLPGWLQYIIAGDD